MKIIVIGMLFLAWVQNSCAAPKWNATDLFDDSDLSTDFGFLDTDLDYTERTSEKFDDDSDLFTDNRFLDMDLDNAELTSNIHDDSEPLILDMEFANGTAFTEKECFEIELDNGTKQTVTTMANESSNCFGQDISDVGLPAIELSAILAVLFIVMVYLGFLVELAQNQVVDHRNITESQNLMDPDPQVNKTDEYPNTQNLSIPSPVDAADPPNTELDSDFLAVMGTEVRSQIDDYQNMLEELILKLNYLHSDLAELTSDAEEVQDIIAELEPQLHHVLKADATEDQTLMFTASTEDTELVDLYDTTPGNEENFDTLPEVDGLEDPFGGFESYELSDSMTDLLEEAFGSYSSRASSEDSLLEITGTNIKQPKDVSLSDKPAIGEGKGDKTTSHLPSDPCGRLQPDLSPSVTTEEQDDETCLPPSAPSCQLDLKHRDLVSPPVTIKEQGDQTSQPPPAPSCQPKMQPRDCPMPPKNRRKVRFYREVRRKTFVVGNPILAFAAPEKKHKIEEFQDTQPLKGDGVGRIPGVLKKNRSFLRSIFRKPSFLKKKEVEKWRI